MTMFMQNGKRRLAALAALATFVCALPAAAQELMPVRRDDPFSALVGKRKSSENRAARLVVERFVVATDNRVFLFQSEGRSARLKFLCGEGDRRIDCLIDEESPAEEIYLLTARRASRGDVVFYDQQGATILRMASYGSATVFWPGESRGHAAARSFGEDPPLMLPLATAQTAEARAQKATALVSALTGAPIVFDAGVAEAPPEAEASVLADAIARTAKGIGQVAEDAIGAKVIAQKIREVRFEERDPPDLDLQEGVLIVGYEPGGGIAGRKPSAAVAKFLEDSL